jgi:molecular chaperone GrpE
VDRGNNMGKKTDKDTIEDKVSENASGPEEQLENQTEENLEVPENSAEIDELTNNWKRALADYKNLEKRVAEDRLEVVRFANRTLILKLLAVFDNLEVLQKHSEDEGIEMILKEFRQILNDEDLQEIEAEGKKFDEAEMEAVELVDGKEGKVMEVTQKGYKLHKKVIRPAQVKVGQSKKEK